VGTRRDKTGIGRKDRKEGAECAIKKERENGEKILNEDGGEIRGMKEIWKRR
jgi:hypothetical protein